MMAQPDHKDHKGPLGQLGLRDHRGLQDRKVKTVRTERASVLLAVWPIQANLTTTIQAVKVICLLPKIPEMAGFGMVMTGSMQGKSRGRRDQSDQKDQQELLVNKDRRDPQVRQELLDPKGLPVMMAQSDHRGRKDRRD